MDLVLSNLEKYVFTVFTWFKNNFLEANSAKSHLLTTSDNVLLNNSGGDQLSSRKYEELLVVLIDHKLTLEDVLNIAKKGKHLKGRVQPRLQRIFLL